ncbi:hypothetical protein REPUB_Repub09cG0111000 [Reevesia pubescens]
MLVEKLIASCNGKCNPIRTFSAEELSKATRDYNVEQEISRFVHFVLYKGFLPDSEISVKRLMFDICEGQPDSLTWKSRTKIAMDIANAVAYLHTALSRPVIHYSLSLISIVIDSNYVAKLADFSLSIAIPKGKSHVVEDTISRRKSRDHNEEEEATFKEFVLDYAENNRLTEIVDQNISSEGISQDELITFANIALCCTQENPDN